MSYRVVLLCIISMFFVSACGSGGGSSDSGEKIVLKFTHNGSERHPFQNGFDAFKEILESETDGAVDVQIFPNEQIASDEEGSMMVQLGTIAGAASSTGGGLAPYVPEADLFNLPFIFRDLDHFYSVLDGPVGKRIALKIEENLDSIVLGYWFSGIRNVWNSKKPILTPEDLKGLKIRVMSSPVFIETFNSLGAQATPMSFGELFSGLQQGVVDGAETDHIDLLDSGFHEVTEHVSLTNHFYLAVGLIFSKKVYNSLPPHIQTAVLKAGAASVAVEREAMEVETEKALTRLKELGTLKFYDVDRSLFQEMVRDVYTNNAPRLGGMKVIQQVIDQ
jgi:tripartite ATP-independent transporter DctP family solute receptor